jgi:3-hydroxybutyryl-CoA dehydrogenase
MFNSETRIGVCGAGAMGAGIAQVAAQAGHDVVVLDRDDAALARGRKSLQKGAAALLKRGKIDAAEADALVSRVSWTLDVGVLTGAGLVIEAIVEDAAIKHALYVQLESVMDSSAVLATNTSSLSVSSLAEGLARPPQFLGLHFFNPAPIMKLVEVVSGVDSDPAIAAAARALMQRWGKVAVNARDVPGFIVNRVARPFYGEGWRALEEDAGDAATLDFLYKDLAGFRMGPLELGDLIGHDINSAAAQSIFDAYDGRTRFVPSPAQARLVAAGRLGRKSGQGVYDYGDAEKPAPSFVETDRQSAPGTLAVGPDTAALQTLLKTAGVEFETKHHIAPGFAEIDNVVVGFCDGRAAGALAVEFQKPALCLDWMRDPAAATALAFSASDDEARQTGLQLAAWCGKRAVELRDRPGLVVFRTLCQLANGAADAVRDEVADADAIDRAMINGVNYPFGPMAWAREYGFARVAAALDAIADATDDNSYNPCEIFRAGDEARHED